MKRILFALGILALVWPTVRQAEAATDVSIDFFYNNLGDDGNWVEVGDYGYCWQPNVATSNSNWRPYADGYWAYTDVGWTWVSNENFGWATYHYGRWARLHDQGWVWVPGREWGPAWVSWRTGGEYVGWAPLPPQRGGGGGEAVYEGRPITSRVDVDFDIGPAYYNFVDVRYVGDQNLRGRILQPEQNVNYIDRTVNVTNITYDNSRVYNHGPDFNRMNEYSTRKIQRLSLERENNVDLSAAVRSHGVTKVEGGKLFISAPMTFAKPTTQVAPKAVKTKIAKPEFERGWSGINDPKQKAELEKKMKAEDPKNIPPMTAASPAGAASPGASVAPATGATPPMTPGTPAATVTPAPESPASPANAKDKGKHGNHQPNATPAASAAATAASASATPNEPKRGDKHGAKEHQAQPTPAPAATAPNESPAKDLKKEERAKNKPAVQPSETTAPTVHNDAAEKVKSHEGQPKGERMHTPKAENGAAIAPQTEMPVKKESSPRHVAQPERQQVVPSTGPVGKPEAAPKAASEAAPKTHEKAPKEKTEKANPEATPAP